MIEADPWLGVQEERSSEKESAYIRVRLSVSAADAFFRGGLLRHQSIVSSRQEEMRKTIRASIHIFFPFAMLG